MTAESTHFGDLAKEVEPPDDGILTCTLFPAHCSMTTT